MSSPRKGHIVAADANQRAVVVVNGRSDNAVDFRTAAVLGGYGDHADCARASVQWARVPAGEVALVGAGLVVGIVGAAGRDTAASCDLHNLITDGAASPVAAFCEMLDVRAFAVRQAAGHRIVVTARASRQQKYYTRQRRAFHNPPAERARFSASTNGREAA